MKFTDFYVGCAVCSGSRTALMTGCHYQRLSMKPVLFPDSTQGLHPEEVTLADMCRAAGYRTACVGPVRWENTGVEDVRFRRAPEDARLQQLVVSYQNTVLNAQREVEDALVAFTRSREEEQFLKESVASAERSVEISLLQYKEGLTDYQRVLDSERFLATQSNRLTDVSGQVSTNLVAAYKGLGGGWQIREGKEILSPGNRNQMIERTNWGGLLGPEGLKLPLDEKERQDWQWPDW